MNIAIPRFGTSARRWIRRALIVLAIAALAIAGWQAKSRLKSEDPAVNYQFTTVQRGDIEDVVTATGALQPRDYVDVGAQVSGQLQKIHVIIGSQVKQGDLLAEIDPTVYRSQVDASRAQLHNLQAQVKDREAQLTLAQIQFRRQSALMAEDATAKENLQTAEATMKSAEAQLEALRAQIEQTESTLRGNEANLQYTRVLSPMTGTVVSITARQGQTLNSNQQAPIILRVADLSVMTVYTQVSEADVGRLRFGMTAYFTTLGDQNKRWYSKLYQTQPTPTITNNVVLYNALFDIPNPDDLLMSDMTTQVFFVVAEAKNTLLIPMGALQQRASRAGGNGKTSSHSSGQADTANTNTQQTQKPQQEQLMQQAQLTQQAQLAQLAQLAQQAPDNSNSVPGTRRATVKVLGADGKIVERVIEIGVTNRISAQVVSGLTEDEKVVSGLANSEPQQKNTSSSSNNSGQRRMMGGPRL